MVAQRVVIEDSVELVVEAGEEVDADDLGGDRLGRWDVAGSGSSWHEHAESLRNDLEGQG